MQPPQQHSWNNLGETKSQLVKKLGFDRSKQYLDYLNRFLSLKLSKAEFDKLCLKTIGKDNIRLHNQLIRAVLKSACTAKISSVIQTQKPSDGVYHQNGSVPVQTSPLTLVNGDILPPSPRKARTGVRERRSGDRKSGLNPNGKTNFGSFSPSVPRSSEFSPVPQNGTDHQELPVQDSINHKDQTESLCKKDGKIISLHAPLGVPFCPVSIGGSHRAQSSSTGRCFGTLHTDGLLETTTLKDRMEQISTTQGLQGVSMDCANVVNNGLDAYLKGLIRSCVELNGTKTGSIKNPNHLKTLNGVRIHNHHHQIQNSNWPMNPIQENEPKRIINLLDFRVSMELNHKKLGEDWPLLLEKICTRAFEE